MREVKSDAVGANIYYSQLTRAQKQAWDASFDPRCKLYLYGLAASGKTTIAALILDRWQREAKSELQAWRIDRHTKFDEVQERLHDEKAERPDVLLSYEYQPGGELDACLTGQRTGELYSLPRRFRSRKVISILNPLEATDRAVLISHHPLDFCRVPSVKVIEF